MHTLWIILQREFTIRASMGVVFFIINIVKYCLHVWLKPLQTPGSQLKIAVYCTIFFMDKSTKSRDPLHLARLARHTAGITECNMADPHLSLGHSHTVEMVPRTAPLHPPHSKHHKA